MRVNALRITCLSITLTDNGSGATRAENEQFLVGLTDEGNRLLDNMADSFAVEMRLGEAMLNHYLTTGNRLPMQDAVAIASKQR